MKKFIPLVAMMLMVVSANALDIELSGSVISDNQKMITSRYMGYVKNIAVAEGDIVKKGQLLYEIDSKEIEAAERQVDLGISQARLALQMNTNQYNNVLTNLARHQRLFEKKMVSKYELETLELAAKNLKDMVEISEKQVAQAEAKKEEVLNQYKYLKVTAPNDGVIVDKKLNEGEMAIPGMPAVVLTDLTKLSVIAEISETQLAHIEIGKEVRLEVPSINLITTGKITSIIPSSNPMTHKFKIKMKFDESKSSVYPGMYTKIHIECDCDAK